jgi:hypothetical protein
VKSVTVALVIGPGLPSGPTGGPGRLAATYSEPSGPTVTVGWAMPKPAASTPTGADQRSRPVAASRAMRLDGVPLNGSTLTFSA